MKYFPFFWCIVHMHECVRACVCGEGVDNVPECTCVEARGGQWFSPSIVPYFSFWDRICTDPVAHHFLYVSWPGSWEHRCVLPCLQTGESNSGRPSLHAYMLGEHFIDSAICVAILNLLLPIPFLRFVYHWLIWWHSQTDLTTPLSFTRWLGILSLCLKNKLKWPNCESLFIVASIMCHTQSFWFLFPNQCPWEDP